MSYDILYEVCPWHRRVALLDKNRLRNIHYDDELRPLLEGAIALGRVRQVVEGVERVTGKALPVKEGPRRPGDPPTLISDPSRIKAALGWKPAHDDLDTIIRSAIDWERRFNA